MASIWKIPWMRQVRRRVRRPLQVAAAPVLTNYIKFVINTSTVISDPPNWLTRAQALHPSIIALWHGQFLLLPGIYPLVIPGRAMISRHDDAEALARVLRYSGTVSFAARVRALGAAIAAALRPRMAPSPRSEKISASP